MKKMLSFVGRFAILFLASFALMIAVWAAASAFGLIIPVDAPVMGFAVPALLIAVFLAAAFKSK